MRPRPRSFYVITLAAAAATAACNESKTPATDTAGASAAAATAPTPAAPAAGGIGVTITSPTEGATTGADVTVTMTAQGVRIEKSDGKRVEGVGHHHLFLDTDPSADDKPIPPTTAKVVHIGTGDSTYTFKGLPAGQHRVIAVIGYGDHTPMRAGRDTVTFTVKP